MRIRQLRPAWTYTFVFPVAIASVALGAQSERSLQAELSGALSWRSIGPDRGGRSIAVAGSTARPLEYFFGATGGGLWKTTDGGVGWEPVTDGQIRSSSVGAVAVAPSNPDVVYIGMGEVQLRGNVMQGDGVYKSTDAGNSWTHLGLADTQVIARIRVHPTNPDLVYVAALGHPTGPNDARGVFRSGDGGEHWEKILYRGPDSGAVDLALDPQNPRILYASLWQVYRNAYQLWSGGEGSALFKSIDGGDNWNELSDNEGFAEGVLGKIGIAVSRAASNRLYAVVEAEHGGLYRSDDGGDSWSLVNPSRDLWQRSFYFNRVEADPVDAETVYILNFLLFRSTDGGETVEPVRTPHADHHDLWIDPRDPKRMICGNDGGGTVSTNAGVSWSHQRYPTAQMYHVTTTRDFPYHVAGAQQDNTTVAVPSQDDSWLGNPRRPSSEAFYAVGGGENAYIASHPENPDIFFAGATNTLTRFDRATGLTRDVQPYPRMFMGESSSEIPERWNWVYPIVVSQTKPHTLYVGSQHVWSSVDEGKTWKKISPDLTRADPETLGPSGGPIVLDQDGPEVYATVFTIAPSPLEHSTIFAGSDDGLVHVTRDGGATWNDITPQDMEPNTRVSLIEASPHEESRLYVVGKRNQMGDRRPYIWMSRDFGKTWRRIDATVPDIDFVHAIREDPKRPGLLYAGTEHGIYVSFDDGERWRSLSLNLPDLQVPDLIVEERDLVIATHGRSFYVLDDIGPIRQWKPKGYSGVHLFEPANAVRRIYDSHIDVYAPSEAGGIEMRVFDARGELAAEFSEPALRAGLNRFRWDLRYPGATVFDGMVLESPSPTRGPWALPGQYRVRVSVDGEQREQPLRVLKDPRFEQITDSDLIEQFELASKIRDSVSAANQSVIEIRKLVSRLVSTLADRSGRATSGPLSRQAEQFKSRLEAVERALYQVKNQSPKDKIAFPIRLNDRLAGLLWHVQRGDGAPNRAHYQVFEELDAELETQLETLQEIYRTELPRLNGALSDEGFETLPMRQ